MITVDQLDATATGILLKVARRWLFFQPSVGHYVWGANGPSPRIATVAETMVIARFNTDRLLRFPPVSFEGTLSVVLTEAGKRLVAQFASDVADGSVPPLMSDYSAPYSVKAALDGADTWVVHALRVLANQPGSSADVRDKLLTAKELISEARIDLGES